jgi:DNA polymerase-3 subunit gamma/tau
MPYEVTAARKRPQSFEQLAGQEFVAATLEKSIETGRIAHAYLFSGPRGCGKTSTARILAKALNCEKGPTPNPCGTCDSCLSITAGSSFDVIEIDGASNTSVDNVRQIKEEVLFPPNSSRYKIYIIDEVHMLSTSAFNALLKTIEEPPPYVIFMFATTEHHKVPATIKSRCQQFTFRLVNAETVVGLLADAARELGVEAEKEALLWIARESGGSVRDAYTLFDQVVSFADGNISAALIREKLGLVGQDRMNSLFGQCMAGDTAAALLSLDSILSSGVSPEQFIVDTVEYCRALLLIKNGIVREGLLGAPLSSFDLSVSEGLGEEKVERLLSIFLAAYRTLKDSIDPRYELDLALAKASHIADYVSPTELARAVQVLKLSLEEGVGRNQASRDKTSYAGALAPPTQPLPTTGEPIAREYASDKPDSNIAAKKVFQPSALPELRKNLIAEIRKNNVLLATSLDKSGEWRMEGSRLKILVHSRMDQDLLKRFIGIIAEVLAQRFGFSGTIEIDSDGAKPHVTVDPKHPQAEPTRVLQDSGFLKTEARPTPASSGSDELSRHPEGAGRVPVLDPQEREAISLVERYFKGTTIAYAPAGIGSKVKPAQDTAPDSPVSTLSTDVDDQMRSDTESGVFSETSD